MTFTFIVLSNIYLEKIKQHLNLHTFNQKPAFYIFFVLSFRLVTLPLSLLQFWHITFSETIFFFFTSQLSIRNCPFPVYYFVAFWSSMIKSSHSLMAFLLEGILLPRFFCLSSRSLLEGLFKNSKWPLAKSSEQFPLLPLIVQILFVEFANYFKLAFATLLKIKIYINGQKLE